MKRKSIGKVLGLLILCTILTGCTAAKNGSSGQEESTVALAKGMVEGETGAALKEEALADQGASVQETEGTDQGASVQETDGPDREAAAEEGTEEANGKETREVTEESAEVGNAGETKKGAEEAAKQKGTENSVSEKAEPELLKEYTGPVQAYEAPETLYATISLNVRRGPGTDYEIMGSFAFNQAVEAIGRTENGWIQCRFNGQTGFASGNYLAKVKAEPEVEKAAAVNTAIPAATIVPGTPASAATTVPGTPVPAATTVPGTPAPMAIIVPGSPAPAILPAAPTSAAATTSAPESTPAAVPATSTPAPAVPVAEGGIIMIGDSRCVQMQTAVGGGGVSWICENGKGYTWLSETAIGWADPSVGKGTKVVICLGVNDPENLRHYAELINAKAADWAARGAIVYYVSVNPVWENPYVTKEEVEYFNSTMPGLLSGVIWVDTYTWLMENGCRIVDGLHYDDPTSVNIFNLIMGSI